LECPSCRPAWHWPARHLRWWLPPLAKHC